MTHQVALALLCLAEHFHDRVAVDPADLVAAGEAAAAAVVVAEAVVDIARGMLAAPRHNSLVWYARLDHGNLVGHSTRVGRNHSDHCPIAHACLEHSHSHSIAARVGHDSRLAAVSGDAAVVVGRSVVAGAVAHNLRVAGGMP